MRIRRQWIISDVTGAASKLEYQVVALIAAAACAALIGRAYLEPLRPSAPSAPVAASKAMDKLPMSSSADEALRSRPASAVEFAAVYGLAANRPYTTLAAAEWSPRTPGTRQADERLAAKPQKKPTLVAQICASECAVPLASIVPPPRPADLMLTAEASAQVDKRVRLLGLSLPGFVPSKETIAKTVVSWGGSIAGIIPGL